MSRPSVSGRFIEGARGPIFVLTREPPADARGCVLVVPPFAEEMNKCRRMVTEVALGLAELGVETVVPDLYGTGDSSGDFSDATWTAWLGDIGRTVQWSNDRGTPVTGILAIRLGCALAARAVLTGALAPVARSVLWQPVFDGSRFLGQFLRLRTAASLMERGSSSVAGVRTRLNAGESAEVAGYSLSGCLATALESLEPPDRLPREFGDVLWLEVIRESGAGLPEPSKKLIEQTLSRGGHVHERACVGEPFWTTTEVVVMPEIVTQTLLHLAGEGRGRSR